MQVPLDVFNRHKDVIAFSNGALYHVAQPPIFANGILSALMVGQLDAEYPADLKQYCLEHCTETRAINHLLFDQANRNIDVMAYDHCWYASGLVHVAPPKKSKYQLDPGGCGKTTTATLLRGSFRPLYVFFSIKTF